MQNKTGDKSIVQTDVRSSNNDYFDNNLAIESESRFIFRYRSYRVSLTWDEAKADQPPKVEHLSQLTCE